jgi:uncharacterized tellurite resistance protein B-like protein
MIFRRQSQPDGERSIGSERVEALVREHMPDADDETCRMVTAVTGLLACVAYVDREYTEDEQAHVREALGRVQGLSPKGVDTICDTLREHIVEIASSNTHAYTRDLRELGAPEMRLEVLEVLVDLAATDGDLAMVETDLLRRVTTSLGLSADDYNAAQARHRDRLSVLK